MASKSYCGVADTGRLCTWLLVTWVVFGFYCNLPVTHAGYITEYNGFTPYNKTSGICKSVDIRNSGEMFENLRGCRVVEGYIQILLFDHENKSTFENISFPELREITGHLLLYRVNGLTSLGKLFPNLAVIRGQQPLLLGYALIIFEMPSLQEIGLYSLTDIMNGGIRIDKNPHLCFANTIDWNRIMHKKNKDAEQFIRSSKKENECPMCPREENGKPLCEYCWNSKHCQKRCKSNCTSCNDLGECCNSTCIGGCSNNDPQQCSVCRNITFYTESNKTVCLDDCPPGLFKYLDRRCVTREECINSPKHIEYTTSKQEYEFKTFNNTTCVYKCPPKYTDDTDKKACVSCDARCRKVCPGISVNNIETAESLKECTHITGSLEIEVSGKNIVPALNANLNMIEEIGGYLKVVRSYPLISLNFLKSLKVIRGKTFENGKYSFVVLDNQNLQELWDWTNRTLTIEQGKLFFHFNPKLCYKNIKELGEKVNITKFDDWDVAENSNGDKTACTIKKLIINIRSKSSTSVQLFWVPFNITDSRKLLSYQIYHIEAPAQNFSIYDSRDACGGDGWAIQDVPIPYDHHNVSKIEATLKDLKPYTQYALYVKTYTIAQEQSGARSDIWYFRTNPGQPSSPTFLNLRANSSSTIEATWLPPKNPNGNLTHYRVIVTLKETQEIREYGNSCSLKFSQSTPKTVDPAKPTDPPPSKNDTCECTSDMLRESNLLVNKEAETESQINFENELQNRVYIKRVTPPTPSVTLSRRKRQMFPSHSTNVSDSHVGNKTYVATYIVTDTKFYVTNLQHHTNYEISVQACRKTEPDKGDFQPNCSDSTVKEIRTDSKPDADNIASNITVVSVTENSITISWKPPVNPNGRIRHYFVDIWKSGTALPERCIDSQDFKNSSYKYTLEPLTPGNYTIRVQAMSDADTAGSYSLPVSAYIHEPSGSWNIFGGVTAFCFIVMGIIIYLLIKKRQRDESPRMNPSINPEYMYVPDDWEIPRKKIELHKELGQGSFGMVYEGIVRDIKGKATIRCAIKTVNEHATNAERLNFLKEASVMKAFDTAHVIKLLGVVSQGQPTLVVMELMANGDLKSYLRLHRPDTDGYTHGIIGQPPSLRRILQMAIEIADGMAYLSAKKFVHRDLAARNCMVAEDLTVKIGDFGMTRDIYETDYYRKGTKGLLPVRWMAPESLKDGVFSSSSDIWSYGVVLWEMATLASQPYQGLSNDQVLRYVIDSGIMERPENCPDKLYHLMRQCWKYKYAERPSFLDLVSMLLEDSSPQFSRVSFYHSAAGMEARSTRNNQLIIQDDVMMPLRLTKELEEIYPLNSCVDDSEVEDDLVGSPHIEFSSYPKVQKDTSTGTANGYVGTNPSNGTRA
ncbi:insulin-like receptor isoform X1 [Onthophagus taurus]|uniref:insulin-like receptor isoform X1 n=1 Tax=Onthophagus taurus TaxID=166361 RepID=UPI000C204D4A|nr:insulin-like receptor isoform X1 [Onthophagus taurus]XP_022901275.1 insulin-like receptor isoform X1 [Onthophagus taurus]XP_022901276.1 insulin-like receptor isoform X1 [Onthophagus taurus]